MRKTVGSLVLLVFATMNARSAELYRCEFIGLPEEAREEQPLQVNVRYVSPAEAPPFELHCEMKAADGRYLLGHKETVRGNGTQLFSIPLPGAEVAARVVLVAWMGEHWERSLCQLRSSPLVDVITRVQAERLAAKRREADGLTRDLLAANPRARRIGVFQLSEATWPTDLADSLAQGLRQDGASVAILGPEALSNRYVLTPRVLDMVVLCNASVLPCGAVDAVGRYTRGGGNLVVLGAPAFRESTWPLDGRWLRLDEYRQAVAASLTTEAWLSFDRDTGGEWPRATNNPASPGAVEWERDSSPERGGTVRMEVGNLTGWDNFGAPLERPRFPEGHTWTSFWAKGDERTTELSIEWVEEDGSRWIGVVALTARWQKYVLPPSAFRYWHDHSAEGRGAPGDQFRPERAVAVKFGLAHTHTTSVANGPHTFWLDDIGSAVPPGEDVDRRALAEGDFQSPIIEAVSPPYKLYSVTNLRSLRASPVQAVVDGSLSFRAPATALAPHPRPQGTGIHKERRWRFVPVLECLDGEGRVCGTAACLVLVGAESADGGMTASFTVDDGSFFAQEAAVAAVCSVAKRMLDGLFLYEGGTSHYASFGGEDMPVGALVTNRGRDEASAALRVRVMDADGRVVLAFDRAVTVPPGRSVRVEDTWPVPSGGDARFRIEVELLREGTVIDCLRHEVRVWQPKAAPEFMLTRDGDFLLGTEKWYAHGVNYMPSSGIGIEDGPYFEYWLDPQPYDPDVIERDLTDIEAIGFNMVSVFQYHRSMASRNLLDLLMRCEDHGLKVNLSLRPGTPMAFPWEQVREMITGARLARNDTVFAYDLAWEPFWGDLGERKAYDREWEKWVVGRYGSVGAAERDWEHSIPRNDSGEITGVPREQLAGDGRWRRLAVAYRAFLNHLLHERYGRARELVRSIDPNHLVSFRMRTAGDPTADQRALSYDLAGLAQAVDIMEPEGYGRIGDWERVKGGWFTAAYSRCVARRLPVLWAEFGYTVWDRARGVAQADRLAFAEGFYEDFYTMAYRSGANGTVCWWFPGGYRWGERSDYGILNPDRSWRGITRVINRWSERMRTPRQRPEVDTWLEFRRTDHADGIAGIYRATEKAFWQAVAEGKTPGLREIAEER